MESDQNKKFTELTGIKVDQEILDWEPLHDKIVTASAAGQAPGDVTEMSWTAQFGAAGWYSDLSTILPKSLFANNAGNQIFAWKGKQIGIPYELDFRGTLVNMTLLNKAGITKPPTTWAEVKADGQKLKDKGVLKYPIGMHLKVEEAASTLFYAITRAAGGSTLNADGDPAWSGKDSPAAKALTFMQDLYASKLVTPGATGLIQTQTNDMFANRQIAIDISASPAVLSQAKKGSIGNDKLMFVPIPGPDGPATKLIGLNEGLGIPAKAAHPGAAAQYIIWRELPDTMIATYSDPKAGALPTQNAALNKLVSMGKLAGGSQVSDAAKLVVAPLGLPNPTWYPQFSQAVSTMVHSVVPGNTSVTDGLSQLASQIKSIKANAAS